MTNELIISLLTQRIKQNINVSEKFLADYQYLSQNNVYYYKLLLVIALKY